MSLITRDIINSAYTYWQFRSYLDELLEQGKTTGENQSEALVEYTRMNAHRMKRLEKKPELQEELKKALDRIDQPQVWLCLVEGWCGDVAQNLPTINKMAEHSENIELKLILRDEYPEIMDRYLTNGARSIPKLIALDRDTLEELWVWGARPADAQKLLLKLKEEGVEYSEIAEQIHRWYAKDKTRSLQQEFREILEPERINQT